MDTNVDATVVPFSVRPTGPDTFEVSIPATELQDATVSNMEPAPPPFAEPPQPRYAQAIVNGLVVASGMVAFAGVGYALWKWRQRKAEKALAAHKESAAGKPVGTTTVPPVAAANAA